MPISREAMTTIEALSVPLERDRREAFINTVVQRVEAAGAERSRDRVCVASGRGDGRAFFDPPDLRVGRPQPRSILVGRVTA